MSAERQGEPMWYVAATVGRSEGAYGRGGLSAEAGRERREKNVQKLL